ncbi:MAG: hypothetical protein B7Z80_27470, partial [Rhodospirillales bacterium 20-64-7]
TLWFCLHLAGAVVSPLLLLAAFGCAAVLGLVSLIPGGFGVMDGVLLLALTAAGVPQGRVGAGLFLFRIVYYLLPMLAGLWLGGGMLAQRVPALARWRVRLAENPLLAVLGVPAGALAEFGVRILALLTFGAGVLLLVSALLPSLHHRMLHASSALALPVLALAVLAALTPPFSLNVFARPLALALLPAPVPASDPLGVPLDAPVPPLPFMALTLVCAAVLGWAVTFPGVKASCNR